MIKLKFNIQQLKEFYSYLLEVVQSIKYSISLTSNVYVICKLKAELGEFNACLLKVQSKVTNAIILNKIQKTYTLSISYMQGYLISTDYTNNNTLSAYINAILSQKTEQIFKTLIG